MFEECNNLSLFLFNLIKFPLLNLLKEEFESSFSILLFFNISFILISLLLLE